MKATFFLPAHPSYFQSDCSQENVDDALFKHQFISGFWFTGKRIQALFEREYVLLTEPERRIEVTFDSTNLIPPGGGPPVSEAVPRGYSQLADLEFDGHLTNIRGFIHAACLQGPPRRAHENHPSRRQ